MSLTTKFSKIASTVLLIGGVGSMLGGVALLLQGIILQGILFFILGIFMLVLLVRLAQYIAQQQSAQQAAQQAAQMGQPQQGQIVVVAYPPQQNASDSLVTCPNCGSSVKKGSNFCPNCGEDLRKATRTYKTQDY